MTRASKMIAQGIAPRMVELVAGHYIMDAFQKLGMAEFPDGGGYRPLKYLDVITFAQGTQAISEPWEIEAVVNMSNAYCDGREYGSKNNKREPIDTGL